MNKKLLALGLIGAAAWLFKTKKGAEVRKNIGDQAGKLSQKAKDYYAQGKERATDAAESFQG